MHQPNPVDVSLETEAPAHESAVGPSAKTRQPWEAPTLDALPLSETYNAPNFNSDGMSGS